MPIVNLTVVLFPITFSSIVTELATQCARKSLTSSSSSWRRSWLTNTILSLRDAPSPKSHSSSSTSVWDRDSLRNPLTTQDLTLLTSWTLLRVHMWTTASWSSPRSSKVVSTSSLFLTQSLKVPWSQLISMLQRIPLLYPRMPFWTSPTLSATTITTGPILLRSLHLACWLIRSPSIAARSATFLQMLTSTSFPSISESLLNLTQ